MNFDFDERTLTENNFHWEQLTNLILLSKKNEFSKVMAKFDMDKRRRQRYSEYEQIVNNRPCFVPVESKLKNSIT